MEYQEKLLEEGRKLVRELEKRIAGNDNFLHDYLHKRRIGRILYLLRNAQTLR
jgi:hypothetical protein